MHRRYLCNINKLVVTCAGTFAYDKRMDIDSITFTSTFGVFVSWLKFHLGGVDQMDDRH